MLKNFGLFKAVRSFINKLNTSESPSVHFNSNIEAKRFTFNVEVVLYRVICELISNTLSHANANNIYIDLVADKTHLSLKYIDDGNGFDEKRLEEEFIGLGYSNIRSRIKSLNGSFDIYTKPGEGVKVFTQIKID